MVNIKALETILNNPVVSDALKNLLYSPETKETKETENETSICKFTARELLKMPQNYRKLFKVGKVVAHTRKKPNGVYEIRVCIDGNLFSSSSKDLELAKEKFVKALSSEPKKRKKTSGLLFTTYFETWLETVKKPYIKPTTFSSYLTAYNGYLKTKFKNTTLDNINSMAIQSYINEFVEQEKFRTAKKIKVLLSDFFRYATADGKIQRNPMTTVKIATYEIQHGSALTREEERKLINDLIENGGIYSQIHVFLMYTGLRVGELKTATVKDGWIYVLTEKQRQGKGEKPRKIPVSSNLARLMPYITLSHFRKTSADTIGRHIKDLLPGHHTHDLRHTFVTRCRECGIQREIVSLWVGHSADTSITSTIYTHLEQNTEIQLEEIKKFDYEP